jgi:hypothetical protein
MFANTDEYDALTQSILIAADDGHSDKTTSFPDFPGEKPSKSALIRWCETWTDDLNGAGYATLLRGEIPFEVQKLTPRTLIPVPEGLEVLQRRSFEAENAKIDHQNAINVRERDLRLLEMRTRLASKLGKALRPKAPVLLKKLQGEHKAFRLNFDGTTTADIYGDTIYDGVAMFLAIVATKNKPTGEYDTKKFQKLYERFRDSKAPDNVTPDAFSNRLNGFTVHINPFIENPLAGERLGRFILEQLPASLGADGRTLKRDLERDKKLDDEDHVLQQVLELVQAAYDPGKKGVGAHVVDPNGQADAAAKAAKAEEERLKRLLVAAVKEAQPSGGRNGGAGNPGWTKAGKKTDADKGKNRPGNRLPEGQRCKNGTCDFDHDRLKPGAPCFRDPRWKGPLPLRVYNDPRQRGRIIAEREVEAKRLGVRCEPLTPPEGATPDDAAPTSLSLVDLLAQSNYMVAPGPLGTDSVLDESSLGMESFDESGYEFWGADDVEAEALTRPATPRSGLKEIEPTEDESAVDPLIAEAIAIGRGLALNDAAQPFETPDRPQRTTTASSLAGLQLEAPSPPQAAPPVLPTPSGRAEPPPPTDEAPLQVPPGTGGGAASLDMAPTLVPPPSDTLSEWVGTVGRTALAFALAPKGCEWCFSSGKWLL